MWKKRAAAAAAVLQRYCAVHWRKGCAVLLLIGALAGAAAGAKYFVFEIEGTAVRVAEGKIAVADFVTTRVVDFAGSPIDPARVRPGDEVEIKRNLHGDVFSLKVKRPAFGR